MPIMARNMGEIVYSLSFTEGASRDQISAVRVVKAGKVSDIYLFQESAGVGDSTFVVRRWRNGSSATLATVGFNGAGTEFRVPLASMSNRAVQAGDWFVLEVTPASTADLQAVAIYVRS